MPTASGRAGHALSRAGGPDDPSGEPTGWRPPRGPPSAPRCAPVLTLRGVVPAFALALTLAAAAPAPVQIRDPPGTLHGFPSLSDAGGHVIADGELAQTLDGRTLRVRLRWAFRDGRTVVEEDAFELGAQLRQRRFSWVEARGGVETRRLEADLATGEATSVRRGAGGKEERDHARLDLPPGGAFAGYGTALAVSQLGLGPGARGELGFVAFTPAPRLVILGVTRDREEVVPAAGRELRCDRYTLHPEVGWLVRLVAHPKDAHLWFTHQPPPALVRAEQALAAKDDPTVIVDVIPRGPARPPPTRPPPSRAARRGAGSRAASRPSTP